MYKKLHFQMTLFCTVVTGSIFLVLTCICLFFAESNLKKNSYASFLTELNTTISHLQEQDSISHQWMNQIQENEHIKLFLYDNNHTLYYQKYHTSEADSELSAEAVSAARNKHGMDIFSASNRQLTVHTEFYFQSSDKALYYVSAGIIPKSNGHLSFLILFSLAGQKRQLFSLRMITLLTDCIALILLAVFSWHFTKRMIIPLKESQKKQTLFIASASHELRAPLSVLRSGLEVLKKTENPQEQKHFIRLMSEEGARMQNLISDMLFLANTDSDSLPLHYSLCQLDSILLNVYEKFEPLAIKKQIHLSVSLPEELLPDCNCDEERFIQVFTILIDNALSYTPSGGKVHLSLTFTNQAFLFRISDTGCGIPDNEKNLIFERFYRADQAHTNKENFGLGLCIAKEIVKRHNGTIRVEDNPGGGSCFIVKLPAAPDS